MLLLLACVESAPPDPADTATGDTGTDVDSGGDTAGDTGASAPDTATDTADTAEPLPTDHEWGATTVGDLHVEPCGSVFTYNVRVAVGPDLDGDGLAEVAFGAPNVDVTAAEQGAVYLVRGADLVGTFSLDDAWTRVVGTDATAGVGFGDELRWVDDRDGDGLAELLVRADGGWPHAVSGADLLAGGEVTATSAWYTPPRFARWDDIDGDGQADWVYGEWIEDATGEHGIIAVVSDTRFTLGALVPDHQWSPVGTRAGDFFAVLTGDLDGDGIRELLTTDGGDAVVLDSAALLGASGTIEGATRWRIVGQYGALPLVLGDADGGGVEDLAFANGVEVCVARGELGDPIDTPLTCLDPGLGELGDAVVAGDLDGDGVPEVWLGGEDATVAVDGAALVGGVLLERARLDHPDARAAGLDADGDSVWVSPYVEGSWGVETAAWQLSGATGATPATVQVHNSGAEPDAPLWMDLSGDGVDDLLISGDALYVFNGVGLRSGGERTVCDADVTIDYQTSDTWSTPFVSPTADVDGDGVADLITGRATEEGTYDIVLRSGAAAYAGAPTTLAAWTLDGYLGSRLGCDVDGDGLEEFVRHDWRQPWTFVSGTFVWDGDATAALLGGVEADDVVGCIPDVDGDGGDEIVTTDDDDERRRVFLSSHLAPARTLTNADAWVELPRTRPNGHQWVAPVRLGDADADGAEDIVWQVLSSSERAYVVCRYDAALFAAGGSIDASAATVCTETYDDIDSVWLDDAVGDAIPEVVVVGARGGRWSARASDGVTFGAPVVLQSFSAESGSDEWRWAYGHGADVLGTGADALWFARSGDDTNRWALDVWFARAR